MTNTIEVRTVNGHTEIRANGVSKPSSEDEIRRLLEEGRLIYWNPTVRPITLSDMKHLSRGF